MILVKSIVGAVNLVKGQKESGLIESIVTKINQVKMANFTQDSIWMFEPRVVGKRIKCSEVFFIVLTKKIIRKLVEDQIETLKETRTRIVFKNIKNEHTARVGFLSNVMI